MSGLIEANTRNVALPPAPAVDPHTAHLSQSNGQAEQLITDTVSQGSYRRPTLPSHGSFRSVTACSPSISPSASTESDLDPLARAENGDRGGRRRLVRSGTSGSLQVPQLLRSPSPTLVESEASQSIPNTENTRRRHSSGSSGGMSPRRVSTTSSAGLTKLTTKFTGKGHRQHVGQPQDAQAGSTLAAPPAPIHHVVVTQPDRYPETEAGTLPQSYPMSTSSSLQVEQLSRMHAISPSVASIEGEEYFSAPLWRKDSTASTLTADGEADDEACYVDGDCSDHLQHSTRLAQIDFLLRLPSELALYIIYQLEDRRHVLAAAAVSKSWRSLAMDQSVWRNLFFSHPGWAIREDAPLVLQKQAQMKKATAANLRAKHLKRAEDQTKSERSTAAHAYADRLTALKSWRETLHLPAFPDIANLSLGSRAGVDVDGAKAVAPTASGSSPIASPVSPLRSPTAAPSRFGLFLSPGRGLPSTTAGKRRAHDSSATSIDSSTGDSRTVAMSPAGSMHDSLAPSIDETIAEAEEDFAVSLDWKRLYIDRYILEQRWLQADSIDGRPNHTAGLASDLTSTAQQISPRKSFEPTKRFLRGHTDSVYCVRQDDGEGTGSAGKLVSGSRDHTIRVWDLDSSECRHVLQGHSASVLSLKYDAQLLVSGSSDSEVYVWDFAAVLASAPADGQDFAYPITHDTSKLIGRLRGHSSAVLDVTFNDVWIVTSSKDATVRVWKRNDLSFFCQFTHGGPVNAIDLQDGKVVSASGDGSMLLWDIETRSAIHTFKGHSKGLACILYRGETVVSGSNDQTIRVWNTRDGKCTHVLQGHDQLVRTVSFDPVRGLVVSGGYDKVIKIWNTRSRDHDLEHSVQPVEDEGQGDSEPVQAEGVTMISQPVRELRCHRARIFDIDFNTTRIISASEDHLICITSFGGQGIDTCLFA